MLVIADSAIRWGDVPTWVGALGTLAAFVIALGIYAGSVSERRKEHARKVSGWVPGGPAIVPAGAKLGASPTFATVSTLQLLIKIHNGSDEVISDVRAIVVSADGTDLGLDPIGWTDVGPGQDIEITTFTPDRGLVRGELRLRIEFTDAGGRKWSRLGGALRRRK